MKVSDAIVNFLEKHGITDVFGYPGGMVVHLMDSIRKETGKITFHLSYNEQGAAFEACAWSLISKKPAVAIATSGPGATNLITGIANAFFDSIPVIFITGQVNTNESAKNTCLRQRGFQETNIVDVVKPITKAAFYVDSATSCISIFNEAFEIATSNRMGPVLIDLPMNIQKADIIYSTTATTKQIESQIVTIPYEANIKDLLTQSKRPVIILGNGIKRDCKLNKEKIRSFSKLNIPFVSTMPAVDLLPSAQTNYFGFLGAYGDRLANILVSKADLIISLGARLDVRQTGGIRKNFAPKAKIIRVDIDKEELKYKIHDNDININSDVCSFAEFLSLNLKDKNDWIGICKKIQNMLLSCHLDNLSTNDIVRTISKHIDNDAIITVDVGQNQIWVAQAFSFTNQDILMSAGLGSMGFSLPAAIGAYYASKGTRTVVSFNGDGGVQMNIQELGMIAREHLPIKVIIFNNDALGMIRVFQEMYFGSYYLTTKKSGFSNPDYSKIAEAYDMKYSYLSDIKDSDDFSIFSDNFPRIIEIGIKYPTYVHPRLTFGDNNDNQSPRLPDEMLKKIREM